MKKILLLTCFVLISFAQDVKYYDETLNPFDQLKKAVKIAKKKNQNIMMIVGGDWCPWCRRLAKLLSEDEKLKDFSNKLVFIKIYYSKNVKNEEFLKQYPKIQGYPHIFVLDKTGKLIHSQDTAELEDGQGYDISKIVEFFNKYVKR